MANNRVEDKPSQTALFTALRRTIAHQEHQGNRFGADDLAECFLPSNFRFFLRFKNIRAYTKAKLAAFLPGLNEYIIARTAYFDSLFTEALKERIPQIVLLGAGYDSRSYRFEKLIQETKIYELDIAPTQARKLKCLKKAKIAVPQPVSFVPIDFNQESLQQVLEKAGFLNQQKTLFIWEGVSYYLDPESVEATLAFFSQTSPPENILAFDYMISITEENKADHYGAEVFFQNMQEHHANEELMFSIDEGKVESFLAGRDLKMIAHFDKEEIERRFLTDDNGSLIGQMTGLFRFVLASPKTHDERESE